MSDLYEDILTSFEGGVRLTIKAKPNASRARLPKIVALAEGRRAVEVAVAAVPEDGKANKAILEALAAALDVKKGDLVVKTGSSGRLKIVEIMGNNKVLLDKGRAWLRQLSS